MHEIMEVLVDIGVIFKDCATSIDNNGVSHKYVITLSKNKNYIILRFSTDWVLMGMSYKFIGLSDFVSTTQDPLKMKTIIDVWNSYLTNINKLISKL